MFEDVAEYVSNNLEIQLGIIKIVYIFILKIKSKEINWIISFLKYPYCVSCLEIVPAGSYDVFARHQSNV